MDRFATRGYQLGSGCTRAVYQSARYFDRVVKICTDDWCNDNKNELDLWMRANKFLRRFLARAYAVSKDGRMLLMQKTYPVERYELLEFRIPPGINEDAHADNFGRLPNGRIVMHDYAGCYSMPHRTGPRKTFSIPQYLGSTSGDDYSSEHTDES